MKIELSIKADYLPGWGASHGLREFLSNAQDARTEFRASLEVRYRKERGTLVIENDGCTLPHEAMLLGHTTKLGRGDLIGRFGEGIKAASLCLIRNGFPVKIRSGAEVWVPKIEKSEKFGAKVLVFYVHTGREQKNRVAVEIENVAKETYDSLGQNFLFLGKLKDSERIVTPFGNLLLGDNFKGRLFVRGVFVQRDDDLHFGYDLQDAEIDRDRKMLARYDTNGRINEIWRHALGSRPDMLFPFTKMLQEQAADVAGINEYNVGYMDEKIKTAVADEFAKMHGSDALPVSSLSESAEVEHLGKRGIVCQAPLRLVLEQTLGNVSDNKAKLATEVTKTYSWHELGKNEKDNLERAIALVNGAEPLTLGDVDVIDCRDDNLRGLFKDGRVMLTKKILGERGLTLRILVHEVAHKAGGGDGERSHVANIERIWSTIVDKMSGGES